MPVTPSYLEYIIEELERVAPVTYKRMFGAAGLYGDGPMFGIVDDDTFYLKVDESTRQPYIDAGMPAFMNDGSSPGGYYQVPAEILEDRRELATKVREAFEVAKRAGERKRARKKK